MSEWRHAQWTGETKDGKRWCVLCRQAWPCDAEAQRLRAERAEAAVRLLQENWPRTIPAPMDKAVDG